MHKLSINDIISFSALSPKRGLQLHAPTTQDEYYGLADDYSASKQTDHLDKHLSQPWSTQDHNRRATESTVSSAIMADKLFVNEFLFEK